MFTKEKMAGLFMTVFLGLAVVAQAKNTAATPDIDPAGGTHYGSVTVTITCTTSNAEIRYTTNGSDVTEASDPYTAPFTLTGSATVKAMAFKTGFNDSLQAEAAFDVQPPRAETPVIAPDAGSFYESVEVTISCATVGADVRFTTNGAEVTESSDLYTAPLTFTETTTVKAKAFQTGLSESLQADSTFTIVPITDLVKDVPQTDLAAAENEMLYFRFAVPTNVATLKFTLTGGTGDGDLLVKGDSPAETDNYDYFPATEGNEETIEVESPSAGDWFVTLLGSTGGVAGVQLTATYDLVPPVVATPTIAPAGGLKIGPQLVTLSCATDGATIYYTLDNSEPTTNSTLYTAPFKLGPTASRTVKAFAVNTGMTGSAVASTTYRIARRIWPGTTLTLSGATGSSRYYAFKPAPGTTQLTLSLTGGTGNANLYVRKNFLPTTALYDYRSVAAGNNERIQIPSPQAGKWFIILVKGKSAYAGAVLKATVP